MSDSKSSKPQRVAVNPNPLVRSIPGTPSPTGYNRDIIKKIRRSRRKNEKLDN